MIKTIKYPFFRLFGIILFIYILSRIDFFQLATVFKTINFSFYLIGALSLTPIFLFRTMRWKLLIDSVGVIIPSRSLFPLMAKGLFLGIATPGKLGEFWRAKYLTETVQISGGKSFYTTLMDRIIDLLVAGAIAIFGIIFIYLKFRAKTGWELYVLIFALFLLLAYILIKRLKTQKILRIFVKFLVPPSSRTRTTSFLEEFDQGLESLDRRTFLKLLGYGFLYYLNSVIAYYFILLALGITLPFWYLFLIIAIVWIVLILPITVLGLGTREAAFIYFFSILGISSPLALTFSLLALFYNIMLAIPGAILFLKKNSLK
ncbi:MAG: flippase-like domain-containing protein [Patescibacteria group bacterium]|nr:flippase-like domain-containing protein [Patescibacteria group bacterium]